MTDTHGCLDIHSGVVDFSCGESSGRRSVEYIDVHGRQIVLTNKRIATHRQTAPRTRGTGARAVVPVASNIHHGVVGLPRAGGGRAEGCGAPADVQWGQAVGAARLDGADHVERVGCRWARRGVAEDSPTAAVDEDAQAVVAVLNEPVVVAVLAVVRAEEPVDGRDGGVAFQLDQGAVAVTSATSRVLD